MTLIQKIMLFLVAVIIIPLVVSTATISINSRIISDDITTSIDQLETEFAEAVGAAAESLDAQSSTEIDALKNALGEVNQTVSAELRDLGQQARNDLMSFQNQLFIIAAGMLFVVAIFSILGSLSFRTRIAALMENTKELASGNMNARVEMDGSDELKRIADAFNIMAERVQFSQDELESINTNLEKMVAKRTEELHLSNQHISDSIDYASRIQRSLLPDDQTLQRCLGDYSVIWQPKDVVGGDFYWHKTIGDRDFLVVMDCTGHGVPGAFHDIDRNINA